jgi:hypothetical protein
MHIILIFEEKIVGPRDYYFAKEGRMKAYPICSLRISSNHGLVYAWSTAILSSVTRSQMHWKATFSQNNYRYAKYVLIQTQWYAT